MTEHTKIEVIHEVSGPDYCCTLSRHKDFPDSRVAAVYLRPIPGSEEQREYEYIQLFEDNPVVPFGQTIYEALMNARASRAGRLWSPDVVGHNINPVNKA